MENEKHHIAATNRPSSCLYFSSLYFVTVGVLYLWGYWSTFNINILEYMSLADVIKTTAYPIVPAFLLSAFILIFADLASDKTKFPGEGKDTKVGRFLNRHPIAVVLLYIAATIGFVALTPDAVWDSLPIFLALPLAFFLKEKGVLKNIITNEKVRSIFLILITTLPFFSFARGMKNADRIVKGEKYQYILSNIDGMDISTDVPPEKRLRLLGHADEYVFLLDPISDTVVLSKLDSGRPLVLKTFKKYK